MAEVVMRIILEPNRRRGRPLRMLLSNSLLRNTSHLKLLAPSQLGDDRSLALGIRNDRAPYPLVRALAADD